MIFSERYELSKEFDNWAKVNHIKDEPLSVITFLDCYKKLLLSPFANESTNEILNASVNILAVEYLIKTNNEKEYSKQVDKLRKLTEAQLASLEVYLSLNMHTANLGAMITQGDYETQKEILLNFLEEV